MDELGSLRAEIEAALGAFFLDYPTRGIPSLGEAMRYATQGGKRLRGAVLLSVFRDLGGEGDPLPFALAVEMIHAYSLVHDDLPSMDNDLLRRGAPSVHAAFGETLAILTGDALQSAAFEVAATPQTLPPDRVIEAIEVLARASGAKGMVGGQVMDMDPKSLVEGPEAVRLMYHLKTGQLFWASARIGAILAGARPHQVDMASRWGALFGYGFQVIDDADDFLSGGTEDDKITLARLLTPQVAIGEARGALEASLEAAPPNSLRAKLSHQYLDKI